MNVKLGSVLLDGTTKFLGNDGVFGCGWSSSTSTTSLFKEDDEDEDDDEDDEASLDARGLPDREAFVEGAADLDGALLEGGV